MVSFKKMLLIYFNLVLSVIWSYMSNERNIYNIVNIYKVILFKQKKKKRIYLLKYFPSKTVDPVGL